MGRGRSGRVSATKPVVPEVDARGFRNTDDADYHDLYAGADYYKRQNLTSEELKAAAAYIDSQKEAGTLYSHSQNLNWLMMQNAASGKPLTAGMNAKQLQTYNGMMSAMHNLGYNVNLTRYDHENFINDLLTKAGVKGADYTHLSIGDIKGALVGTKYGEERLITTSYNNFKNAPQKTKNTFMNRAVRIEYRAKASTQAMMPGNGSGGQIGEVVIAPSAGKKNFRILDVRYDNGVKVRKKGAIGLSSQRQLVIVVEV